MEYNMCGHFNMGLQINLACGKSDLLGIGLLDMFWKQYGNNYCDDKRSK